MMAPIFQQWRCVQIQLGPRHLDSEETCRKRGFVGSAIKYCDYDEIMIDLPRVLHKKSDVIIAPFDPSKGGTGAYSRIQGRVFHDTKLDAWLSHPTPFKSARPVVPWCQLSQLAWKLVCGALRAFPTCFFWLHLLRKGLAALADLTLAFKQNVWRTCGSCRTFFVVKLFWVIHQTSNYLIFCGLANERQSKCNFFKLNPWVLHWNSIFSKLRPLWPWEKWWNMCTCPVCPETYTNTNCSSPCSSQQWTLSTEYFFVIQCFLKLSAFTKTGIWKFAAWSLGSRNSLTKLWRKPMWQLRQLQWKPCPNNDQCHQCRGDTRWHIHSTNFEFSFIFRLRSLPWTPFLMYIYIFHNPRALLV